MQQISVPFHYPVFFGHGFFHPGNPALMEHIVSADCLHIPKVFVFLDSGLVSAQQELPDEITRYFSKFRNSVSLTFAPATIPGGEIAKTSRKNLDIVLEAIASSPVPLCRQSYILAVGGGSFLDIVGLGASLVHRGLRLIRVPSTVLSQNDAAVGVKNGMDSNNQKNFIGTFAPPHAVFCDFSLLDSLPDKYWHGGIAEAFKVAMIKDAPFYHFLCNNAEKLAGRDMPLMEELIQHCATLHLDHIREGGDPFEFGSNRPLDFGHWSAHKLEILSGYQIGHGQAVSVGMALDVLYASLIDLVSPTECNDFITALSHAHLPIYSELLTHRDEKDQLTIINGLDEFREHLGGELSLTLPDGIGHKAEIHQVDFSLIEKAIHMLQELDEKQKACL